MVKTIRFNYMATDVWFGFDKFICIWRSCWITTVHVLLMPGPSQIQYYSRAKRQTLTKIDK
jgi:hypothetical protein